MVNWILTNIVKVLFAAAVIFIAVLFREAVKDIYTGVKRRIWPADPEPVEIGRKYEPKTYAADSLVWVDKNDVEDKLREGYSHYLDPSDGARRYRLKNSSTAPHQKDFYMVRPDAKELNETD